MSHAISMISDNKSEYHQETEISNDQELDSIS